MSPSKELADSDYGIESNGARRANRFTLKRDQGTISSRYYSNGCHRLISGGSCELLVEYSGSVGMQGGALGAQALPKGAYEVSGLASCPKVSGDKQTCVLKLTHQAGNSLLGSIRVYVEKPSRTIALVNTQPNWLNQELGNGVSDLINVGAAVFGPVAADAIEKLLGMNPEGAILNDLSELSAQISAISSTVNQILNDVQQIENLDILEFSELEENIQDNNLKNQLEALNQNTLGGAQVYAGFESAIISGSCPVNASPAYVYPSASQIAATPAYLSGVFSALGCDVSGQSTTCSNLNTALQDVTNLVQGVGRFDQTLFQSVNRLIQANLTSQFSVSQFQSNNESLIAYGTLIAQVIQMSYNMIHTALHLSQVSRSPSFPGLIIPITSPQMSPNFSYAQNKEALDQYFTDLGNQLQEDFYASVMTDNPGDPSQLWSNNLNSSLSPKLIAAELNAIPAGTDSWVSTCNLYEWSGALTPADFVPGTVQQVCSATGVVTATVPNPPTVPVDYLGGLTETALTANCYYQGRDNSSSISFAQCQADLSGSPATQANIHAALTKDPYLQCNIGDLSVTLPNVLGPSAPGSVNSPSSSIDNGFSGNTLLPLTVQSAPTAYVLNMLVASPFASQGCQSVGGDYGNTGSVGIVPFQMRLANGEMLILALGYGVAANSTNYQQICARDFCTQEPVGCSLGSYAVLQCLSASQYVNASCVIQGNGSVLYTTPSGIQLSLVLSSSSSNVFQVSVDLSENTQCLVASDCSNGLICSALNNQCGCIESAQCSNLEQSVCNIATNQCVQCLNNSDCHGADPICDTQTNQCVTCLQNSDCTGKSDTCVNNSCNCGNLGGACASTSCLSGECGCGDIQYGDGYCPLNQTCEMTLVQARVEYYCR